MSGPWAEVRSPARRLGDGADSDDDPAPTDAGRHRGVKEELGRAALDWACLVEVGQRADGDG